MVSGTDSCSGTECTIVCSSRATELLHWVQEDDSQQVILFYSNIVDKMLMRRL